MRHLFASVARSGLLLPRAFINTNAGGQIFICATPEPTDLDVTGFDGLTWIEVKNVGDFGETGTKSNILTYNVWGTGVAQKAKGVADAGSPVLELARTPTDPGQIALKAAASTNLQYALKMTRNDAPAGGTPSTFYYRGIIDGPTRPNGKVEDFDLEMYTFGFNQREVYKAAAAGS